MVRAHPSPNFDQRDAKVPLAYIVLHYTGMATAQAARDRLCDPASRVSAHYLIDEDGTVAQLVDEAHRAWHAGASFWRGVTDLNSASVGIELVNPGHEWGYRPFPAAQIAACLDLVRAIVARHALNPRTCLLAHSDIAPGRRHDPGELFPWQAFAAAGFGVWPTDLGDTSDAAVKDLLDAIGYDTADMFKAVTAFQRRYHPENITGTAYPDTVARLRALAKGIKPLGTQ